MDDDIATKYKINSHRTAVLHDDTLVVTVSDPIEYVERAHSVRRRLQALNALLAGGLTGMTVGLVSSALAVLAGLFSLLVGGFGTPYADMVYFIVLGACVGLGGFSLLFAWVAELLMKPLERRKAEVTVVAFPMKKPDSRKGVAVRAAFAERVTEEARDQMQDMVVEGHEEAAKASLRAILESCRKASEAEGEAQGKALTALMKN